ncbi:DUF2169 family type VI secretion system accessory protein [Eleftheria terrae]|uniref:DUF2169 family type VI secretion system accessory protein n=1 Tax=Eleftheria terrae TaxID=1597781 RepID=UPI00263BE2D2|nr:DUF2169 domain-containing protein [Eleftheria terrae]WKB53779.1 DUF2169 domain-containing protein [Eleftheria terrae]
MLHRCFERQQRAWLGVSVIGFVPLAAEPALLPEQELWQMVPSLLGDTPLDVAVPKQGAEFVLAGDACAPAGQPLSGLKVGVRVGGLRKELHVFGERQWIGPSPSEPRPFERLPLVWQHAYGGPGFELNPLGLGHVPLETPSGRVHPLPHIEYPTQPSVKPSAPLTPAGFAALGAMAPQRKRFDGTYDDAWLQQDFPGTPRDIDWRYFCVGSEDQWQSEPFVGDEPVELLHLHPEHPRLAGRLPGIRPVIAVRDKRMSNGAARFLEPRLTTVWLFPNQLRMALVWHALMPVADEFADQVELMQVGAEWLHSPKPREHYLKAIDERLDDEHGALRMLDDEDLLPEGMAAPNEALARYETLLKDSGIGLERHQDKLRQSQQRLEAELKGKFGDTAVQELRAEQARTLRELGLPDPLAPLPSDIKGLMAVAKQLPSTAPGSAIGQWMSSRQAAAVADAHRTLQAAGQDRSWLGALQQASGLAQAPQGFARSLSGLDQGMAALPAAVRPGDLVTPELRNLAAQADTRVKPMLNAMAHLQDAPARLDAATAGAWREGAAQAKAQGRSFAGLRLQAADFRGMDLAGVDFSGAQLEGADFSEACLDGARFDGASLAHAKLARARVEGTSFAGANLGKADMTGAAGQKCNFTDAVLGEACLAEAVLQLGTWQEATLLDTDLQRADLSGARLEDAVLMRCRLGGARLDAALLNGTSFIECDATGASFRQAALAKADFVTCLLDGACFDEARADNLRAVHQSSLKGASFVRARLQRANLRGMPLHGANFSYASADAADFGESEGPGAVFVGASLKETLFAKAVLTESCFAQANLMSAILQHADLRGADLSGCNLYGADLARLETDDRTRWDQTFTAKARTLPARKVLPVNGSAA